MKLELYQFDSCPYCRKVLNYIDSQNLRSQIEIYDTLRDDKAYQRLMNMNGDDQVPCLVVDGKPILESDDIIEWLKTNLKKSA